MQERTEFTIQVSSKNIGRRSAPRLNDTYRDNQQLRAQLLKTEGRAEGYEQQLNNFQQKVIQGMNAPKYGFTNAQFAGGYVAGNVEGNQYGLTVDQLHSHCS